MRVAATLAYDGTNYLGSQIQSETNNTIFGELERVLLQLGIKFRVVASGRTDKGVHATGQVCHFDLPPFWSDTKRLLQTLNQMLPSSIKVAKIQVVDAEFHARYSAKKRSYRYILKVGDANPFEANFVTFIKELDFAQLEQNIRLFIGEHDFKNFMKTGSDVGSTSRIIYRAFTYRYKDYIILHFQANGFLRSQIRLMVGALLSLSKEEIEDKLKDIHNHKIKPAPSNGLYLAKILY